MSSSHQSPEVGVAQVSGTRLPLKKKIAWGIGSISGNYTVNGVNSLVIPIYNIGLGIPIIWLGWALAIPRILDALTDPLMGAISDNTRSRWGRRRPWIFIGSILTGLLVFLMWIPPQGAGTHALFIYFLFISILTYLAFTIVNVPFMALGYELTRDYDDRTRVQGVAMILGLVFGLFIPWLYKLCFLPIFGGDEMVGIKYVGGAMALLILLTGITPAIFCRERVQVQAQPKMEIKKAFRVAIRNSAFQKVLLAQLVALTTTFLVGPLMFYLNVFYVFDGERSAAATVMGFGGTLQMTGAALGLVSNTWISQKLGKRHAAILCFLIAICGVFLYLILLRPEMPYLQLISWFMVGFGMQGAWLMCASMVADVCDSDEIETGLRREGIYGAVNALTQKGALALAGLLSGYVVAFSGFHQGEMPGDGVINTMLHTYIWVQVCGLLLAIIAIYKYPLTRHKVNEIQAELLIRKGHSQEG
jgi:glycoside/pentoside/hexuronide:cation symporter, GPH family